MSMGKTADDGTVLVFMKEGTNVFKEEDVLMTCKGEPILIGIQDNQGRYRILLMQQRGHWQPRRPSKQAQKALRQVNSIYNIPYTEQAIKWMHAICGYPVKSTWLKAIKVGNYIGWPMLTERNVQKYYPKTTKTAKGHLNQTRKCWVRYTHCSDYEAQGASGNYEAGSEWQLQSSGSEWQLQSLGSEWWEIRSSNGDLLYTCRRK